MKINLLTLMLWCITSVTFAQAPKAEWTKAIGGTGNERANSVATDTKGNIILAGRFQSPTIRLDNVTLTKNKADSADVADIFIIKLDKNGKTLWAFAAGNKGDDHATSCVTDKNDNIYVVGWFESKILKLGGITLNNKTEKGSDMYVAKFSPKGECIWAKNAGGEGGNGDYSTIVLDKGNNVVTGGIAGAVMDFGNGVKLTSKKGGMYFAKYANNGDLLWAKGAEGGECQGVGVDHDNNVVAGGYFNNKTTFGDITLSANGEADAYAVKFSPEGKALWAKNLGGKGTEIASCETDPYGNVYVGGMFFSDTIRAGKTTLVNNGQGNAFIAKYDNNGNMLWAKSAGGSPKGTGGREFCISNNGDAYVTGSNFSDFTFAGQSVKNVAGSEDIFLLKYDKDGNEVWGSDYGGTGRNAGRGITTDKNGNIFLTGSFDEKQLKIDSHTLTNAGDSDIFIAKFGKTK